MLSRVCAAALPMLGVTSAAVVMMPSVDHAEIVAVAGSGGSDGHAIEVDVGEGPGRDAYVSRRHVLTSDLEHDGRWPVFTPRLLQTATRATFVMSAHIGIIRAGVVRLQRSKAGPLEGEELADARVLTEVCTLLMVDGLDAMTDTGAISMEWPDRAVVHQATGMVSVQISSKLADALARLRAYAFANDVTLDDVARAVVERRLRFDA